MFTGIDRNEIKIYKSPNDPDQSNPTVFTLGLLDPNVRNTIEDCTSSFDIDPKNPNDKPKVNFSLGKRNHLIVKYGLKGIEGFIHPKTKEQIKFETKSGHFGGKLIDGVSDEILDMLPSNLKTELAEVIWNEEKFREGDLKN